MLSGAVIGLLFGLLGAALFGLLGGLAFTLPAGFAIGLIGLGFGLACAERMAPRKEGRELSRALFVGQLYGLVGVVLLGLLAGAFFGVVGLALGLGGGLILGSVGASLWWLHRRRDAHWNIRYAETLSLSSPARERLRPNLYSGMIGGIILGLLGGFAFSLPEGLALLLFGLSLGLFSWLRTGLVSSEIETRKIPNEAVWRSLKSALIAGVVGAFYFGLVGCLFWSISQQIGGPSFGLVGLVFGLFFGLLLGLEYGGAACLQYFFLRIFLWSHGFTPWKYICFLDYAADHILLHKVGSGYTFVHPLLMEHFATLEPDAIGMSGSERQR